MWLLSRSFFPSTSSMSKCFHTLAFKAEGAGWMLRSAISCILFCAHHRLSGCCTSTLTSSAYCVPSTLRCQLTFRKWIFDICELTQNRPHLHRGASKNRFFFSHPKVPKSNRVPSSSPHQGCITGIRWWIDHPNDDDITKGLQDIIKRKDISVIWKIQDFSIGLR